MQLLEPVTHRSDRYGWAGWIHWETSGAHFYAWEQPRLFAEDGFKRFAERPCVDVALGRVDMPLDRRREEEVSHGRGWQEPRRGDGL